MNEELKLLTEAIERSLGHRLATPRDFEHLSECLQSRLNSTVSVSTLKRLWGYVPNQFQPSQYTLNLLARFVGYDDWEQFVSQRPADKVPSDPIMSDRLNVRSDLQVGDRLRLVWVPDRVCVVRYLGDLRFVVEHSQATRLQPGDTFECGLLIAGEPLYLDNLCQLGRDRSAYVCGQVSGIRYEFVSGN